MMTLEDTEIIPATWATRDPLITCGGRHLTCFDPRPLCRVSTATDPDATPRLEVRVSACAPESIDLPAPALIMVLGSLDTDCATRIAASVREFIGFANDVVIDLASVCAIDNGGVAFIESLHRQVIERGGSLALHDPNIMVERILQMCGVDAVIPVCRPA